ncbi:MAG: cytochrome c biogenesis protein CcsA [Deltaproteobacteria bacterium]|nr:cytochrome c biogenesis protein CcsA [Deltaproteobacteria bacterium]
MALFLLKICVVFYVLTMVVGVLQLVWPRATGDRTVLVGFATAAAAHVAALALRAIEVSGFPMANLHDALSLFGFLAALITVIVSWRLRVPQAAAIGSILVAALVMGSVVIEPAHTIPPALRSHWLPVHIAFAFLGDAAFLGAGIVSVIYLVQDGRLRHKRKLPKPGTGVHQLPPLEMLDRASIRLVNIGFPLMTLGLVTGGIYGHLLGGTFWLLDPRNLVSGLVWLLYAVLLHFRISIGWRGRKLAWLTLVGVVVTLLAFVVFGIAGVGHHAGGDYVS